MEGNANPSTTDLYHALFAATRDGLLVVDDEGVYVDVNDAYAGLLGSTRSAVIGRHFTEFMPPDRLAEAMAAFEDLKQDRPALSEFPLRAVDGTLVDCEWTVHAHFLPGLSLCCARDIRGRKLSEQSAREKEAQFRCLAAIDDATRSINNPEEVVRTVARLLGEYLAADSVAYSQFESDQEHFVVIGDYRRMGAPSLIGKYTLEQFGTAVGDALRANEAFMVEDIDAAPPPGAKIEAYRQLKIRAQLAVPLHKNRRLVAAMGVQHLTARKWRPYDVELLQLGANRCWESVQRAQVETQLRRRTRSFDTLLTNLPDLICTFDLHGRFSYANPALLRIWQRSLEEIIGKNTFDLGYPPDLAARIQNEVKLVINTQRPVRNHTPFAGPGGETRLYEYIFSPVQGSEGLLEGVTCTARDITDRTREKEALADSERRFRAFVTTSSDAVYMMSPDWSEMRFLHGRNFIPDTSEASGGWIDKYIHPDDQAGIRAAIGRAIGDKAPFEFEHRVIRVDGSLGWTFSRAVPLLDMEGNIVEWVGAARDITGRKESEKALVRLTADSEQQRRLYQTILSSTPDLVYVFDLNHRFTYANKALLTTWGKTAEEAIGKNCLELGYEPWHAAMHDREIEQVIATKEPIRGDVPFTGTQGRRVYDYLFVPVFGPDGEVEAIAGTTRDVTDRKLAEEQLREAADRLTFMAESMPQKIFTAKPDGEVDYFNRQWMEFTGLQYEQIHGWGWLQFLHPDDLEENARIWRNAVDSGEPLVSTHRVRRADGVYRWHLTRAVPMRDRDGKISLWLGSTTEIHEQKRTEEELRRANKDLEQFAYSASHDLQEPLRGVKIYSELLAMQYRDKLEGEGLDYLEFLMSGATRMEMLVRDLLTYTRASMMDTPAQYIDASQCLRSALANLGGIIKESSAKINADPLPSVPVHATHLQQVFQNLVGNAVKYRRPNVPPEVQIAAHRHEENWLFSVSDNGIGIEPEYQNRIFGLFKRLHSGDEYSGTGIGLALCLRIVEQYHGRIWVESEPGKGSIFYFTLPV
jgi:PAS domain S-box-containing protein